MGTLNEFAKENKTRSGYKAWREKTPENVKAWSEALSGYESGLDVSTIVRWLKQEQECPLSYHTIRTQLHDQSKV